MKTTRRRSEGLSGQKPHRDAVMTRSEAVRAAPSGGDRCVIHPENTVAEGSESGPAGRFIGRSKKTGRWPDSVLPGSGQGVLFDTELYGRRTVAGAAGQVCRLGPGGTIAESWSFPGRCCGAGWKAVWIRDRQACRLLSGDGRGCRDREDSARANGYRETGRSAVPVPERKTIRRECVSRLLLFG